MTAGTRVWLRCGSDLACDLPVTVARLWLQRDRGGTPWRMDPHKRSAMIEVIDGRERVLA